MTHEQQLREALEYIRYLCKPGYDSVDNMTAEEVIDRCHHEAVGALSLPSQRPDNEGVVDKDLSECAIRIVKTLRDSQDAILNDAEYLVHQITPYLRAKPDAGLTEDDLRQIAADKAYARFPDCKDADGFNFSLGKTRYGYISGYMDAARQHTYAGAWKGVVDEEALAKAAYDAVLRIRESEDAPGFDICLKAEMDNRRPIIETYVAALAQWKVSV